MQKEKNLIISRGNIQIGNMKISVKTRIGKDKPEEFYEFIKIYNKYPLEELIIHPRTQKDYYIRT